MFCRNTREKEGGSWWERGREKEGMRKRKKEESFNETGETVGRQLGWILIVSMIEMATNGKRSRRNIIDPVYKGEEDWPNIELVVWREKSKSGA